MKSNAVLINMARGGIVDTAALTQALEDGAIGGAGLDVIEEEPFPSDHPLWRMPNVYITPHMTPQVPNRAGRSIEIIRENARRFGRYRLVLRDLTLVLLLQQRLGKTNTIQPIQRRDCQNSSGKILMETWLDRS